jgi:hypothetical protein
MPRSGQQRNMTAAPLIENFDGPMAVRIRASGAFKSATGRGTRFYGARKA